MKNPAYTESMIMSKKISLIIPTKNRPLQLKTCLENLLSLENIENILELVIFNDGGIPPVNIFTNIKMRHW